jgi:hypothetical protein
MSNLWQPRRNGGHRRVKYAGAIPAQWHDIPRWGELYAPTQTSGVQASGTTPVRPKARVTHASGTQASGIQGKWDPRHVGSKLDEGIRFEY